MVLISHVQVHPIQKHYIWIQNIDEPQNFGDSKQQIMRGNDDIFDSDDYDCLDKSRSDLSDSICDENNPDSIFCQNN